MVLLCFAHQPPAFQAASQGKATKREVKVPHGLRIRVALKTNLDSNSAKVGDSVLLEASEDVRDENRVVLIPWKAQLRGRVSEVVPWAKDTKESRLSVVVESAEWKNGHASLHAFIWGALQIPTGPPVMVLNLPGPVFSPSAPSALPNTDVRVRTAADAQIGSELVSNKKSVVLRGGTTFIIVNWTQ
jgi:hypothetical protein